MSRHVKFGICAMETKVKSRPMLEILNRLKRFNTLIVIVFPQDMILNKNVEEWPLCDAFLTFFSTGFPIHKSMAYARLRRPFLINDIQMQYCLQNRLEIYKHLKAANIRVPNYVVMDRSVPKNTPTFRELEDSVQINGTTMTKPFVEKPINAEDHNIYIYFPAHAGGGRQELFRKVGNKSSHYVKQNNVRREGSYIYEEFMMTDGTDIKVYTVGHDYAHAEARKSPALDGKVERDRNGKELRFPIILSQTEKLMAKSVVEIFKQLICGFDLLRANSISYICDVNGFSFVKTSQKYFDDCSWILRHILTKTIYSKLPNERLLWRIDDFTKHDSNYMVPTTTGRIMELRSIIAIIRHGNRTPKQKIKLEVYQDSFHDLFDKFAQEDNINGKLNDEIKLKKPSELQDVLDTINDLLSQIEGDPHNSDLRISEIEMKKSKFRQMKTVLEMYGHFTGINRKVQMKYPHMKTATSSGSFRFHSNKSDRRNNPLLIVLKWGGELTKNGKQDAERLGEAFRSLYPGGTGTKGETSTQGLLRLHSTYRHDLKIYASDEGRVQMTAAAFAKGFLALEGAIPPILVQMVKSANTNGLLDNYNESDKNKRMVKKRVFDILSQEKEFNLEDYQKIAPCSSQALLDALKCIGNPSKACNQLLQYIKRKLNHLLILNNTQSFNKIPLYHNESWDLLRRRWRKLIREFKPKGTKFDLSKIPDIYDNIKYDVQCNPMIILLEDVVCFFKLAKCLADIIVPQEYGITRQEKLEIGRSICTPLFHKIRVDAQHSDPDSFVRLHPKKSKGILTPDRFVRTRLYFTSECHLHAFLSCIRFGDLKDANKDAIWKNSLEYVAQVSELNYLSQIVIMIYENHTIEDKNKTDHFQAEVHFSPGLKYVDNHIQRFFNYCIKRNKYKKKNLRRTSSDTDIDINKEKYSLRFENFNHGTRSETFYKLRKRTTSSFNKKTVEDLSLQLNKQTSTEECNETSMFKEKLLSVNSNVTSDNMVPLKVLHNKITLMDLENFLFNNSNRENLQSNISYL